MNTFRQTWAYISLFITLILVVHYGKYLVDEIVNNLGWDYRFTVLVTVLFFYSIGIGLYWSSWKPSDFDNKK